MLRKTVSVVLAVSFAGTASSGILMLINKEIVFRLKIHPVHDVFGVLMILAGILHFVLNFHVFRSYYKHIALSALSTILVILLGVLYAAGINRSFDPKFLEVISALETKLHLMKHDNDR